MFDSKSIRSSDLHNVFQPMLLLFPSAPHIDGDVVINPVRNGGYLHRNFRIVHICRSVKSGIFWIVANIGDKDILIKPGIGSVSKCEIQNITFSSVGNVEEIFIQHSCEVSETAVLGTLILNRHQIYSH